MNKKKCPQCKNLILLTAPTCLYCGRPNKFVTDNYVQRKWDKEYNKNKTSIYKFIISRKNLFIIIIIIILIVLFVNLNK